MKYKLFTNKGKREINEDSAFVFDNRIGEEEIYLFVLGDGLGGHGHGEVASRLLIETAKELFDQSKSLKDMLLLSKTKKYLLKNKIFEDDFSDYYSTGIIARIMEETQRKLLDMQKEKNALDEMKSTAVILLISDTYIQWGHIGDSRLYYFQKGKLIGRTLDHSVPQMLASAGEIKNRDIRNHPDRSRLLRVLGSEWGKYKYQISSPIKRNGNEEFLLCSDGFWELISEDEMQKTLKISKDSSEWLDNMRVIVNKKGQNIDMDNNTAIAIV